MSDTTRHRARGDDRAAPPIVPTDVMLGGDATDMRPADHASTRVRVNGADPEPGDAPSPSVDAPRWRRSDVTDAEYEADVPDEVLDELCDELGAGRGAYLDADVLAGIQRVLKVHASASRVRGETGHERDDGGDDTGDGTSDDAVHDPRDQARLEPFDDDLDESLEDTLEVAGSWFQDSPGAVRARSDGITARLAASYARKSDPNDLGIEAQHAANVDRAARDGYVIPDSPEFRYSDDDTKGYAKTRKDFDRMCRNVKRGARFTRLYVKDDTRFGRWRDFRAKQFWEYSLELDGVQVRYGNLTNQPTNYSNPTDPNVVAHAITSAVDGIRSTVEVDRTRERSRGERRELFKRGFWVCGGPPPYGTTRWLVDVRTQVPVEELPFDKTIRRPGCRLKLRWATDGSLEIVTWIFDLADGGLGAHTIARRLNEMRIPPPSVRRLGKRRVAPAWTASVVLFILHQRIYRGDAIYGILLKPNGARLWASVPTHLCVSHTKATQQGTKPILYRGFMPNPPISVAQWNRVQRKLEGRRFLDGTPVGRKRTSPRHLLAGLVRCATCQRGYHGAHGGQRRRTDNRMPVYYRHDDLRAPGFLGVHPGACVHGGRLINGDRLDPFVIAGVRAVLAGSTLARRVQAELDRTAADLAGPSRQQRLANAEKALTEAKDLLNAVNNLRTHERDPEQLESLAAVAAQRADAVRAARLILETITAEDDTVERLQARLDQHAKTAVDLVAVFDQADSHVKHRIVAAIVDQVRIGMDEGTIDILLRVTPEAEEAGEGWASVLAEITRTSDVARSDVDAR